MGTIWVLPEITRKDEQQEPALSNFKHNQNPVLKGHKPDLFGKTKTKEKVLGRLCSKEGNWGGGRGEFETQLIIVCEREVLPHGYV